MGRHSLWPWTTLSLESFPGWKTIVGHCRRSPRGGADAVIVSYGNMLRYAQEMPRSLGVITSLAFPDDPAQVETAARAGAEGVKSDLLRVHSD